MEAIKSFFTRILQLALCFIFAFQSGGVLDSKKAEADPALTAPNWSRWVHEHWIWEHHGTQESAVEYVNEYLSHDIPVGVTHIEPPWATALNTFQPDTEKYPDMQKLIDDLHGMDLKVLLWATCMVNEEHPGFNEAKEKGYLIKGGKTVKWWLGNGAFIDYTNPEAVEWWHSQMDTVLDMGIDGWKVDGVDPYILLLTPIKGYQNKSVSWGEYKKLSYDDFFNYTREKNGKDTVILARPVDDQLVKLGLMPASTTRDINFAGWVGDQDSTWEGMVHALNNMFSSAKYNFVSYGSDINGFRDRGQTKEVFLRWTQLGALSPIMENGGQGEHRPWMYDAEGETQALDIYRKFTALHYELIPYIYSQAAYSYELEKPTLRPQTGEYIYMLGDDILVAPFFEAGTSRRVRFPKGEWIYMFDESKVYEGGRTAEIDVPLDEMPVFIRKGAILPLEVTNSLNAHGSELSAGYTTVLVYPEIGSDKFGLYEQDKNGTMLSYTKDKNSLTIKSGESERALLFKIDGAAEPETVKFADGNSLDKVDSMEELVNKPAAYFSSDGDLWIAVKDVSSGVEVIIK